MNISKNTHKPMYICDKCGKEINYTYRKGRNVYKYYSYNPRRMALQKTLTYVVPVKRNLENGYQKKRYQE